MNAQSLCGKEIATWVGLDAAFGKVLTVAYDDGPTRGALQCRLTSNTYSFELLARDVDGTYDLAAWDHGREIRIFSLTPLPPMRFKQLNKLLSMKAAYRRMAEDSAFYDRVRAILATVNPPQFVIATHGISAKIIAIRDVATTNLSMVANWFAFLGLESGTSRNDS